MTDSQTQPEGLYNFRDTGGTPLSDGGTTRSGVLFRSEALDKLTPQGIETFAATPIGVVVDMRTDSERNAAPDKLPTSRPIKTVELSILAGFMKDLADQVFNNTGSAVELPPLPTLTEMYTGMLRDSAAAFAQIARLVSKSNDDEPTAVLVHCTAGKDRTGIATALILEAVGAERLHIVADYSVSECNLAGAWSDEIVARVTALGVPMTGAVRTLLTKTPASVMEEVLTWLDNTYGGAVDYLKTGGLTDEELVALRARLRS